MFNGIGTGIGFNSSRTLLQQALGDAATDLPITVSSLAAKGSNLTLTRADATSCATVMGYAPSAVSTDAQVLLTCDANELRTQGARRISSGVWSNTFADGVPIPTSTLKGLLTEPSRTNLVWPCGYGVAGVTQTTAALTAAAYTLSFKGTGSVTGTGGFVGVLTGTGANNTVSLTATATAAAAVLTVSGSITEMQLELGATASSPIITTTAAVTRAGDVATIPTASNITAAAGSIYLEFLLNTTQVSNIFTLFVDSNNYIDLDANYTLAGQVTFRKNVAATLISNATAAAAYPSGTLIKVAVCWGALGMNMSINGTAYSNVSITTLASLPVNLYLGQTQAGVLIWNNNLKNLLTWTTQLTANQLNALTR
jgi:hypothetical protein